MSENLHQMRLAPESSTRVIKLSINSQLSVLWLPVYRKGPLRQLESQYSTYSHFRSFALQVRFAPALHCSVVLTTQSTLGASILNQ